MYTCNQYFFYLLYIKTLDERGGKRVIIYIRIRDWTKTLIEKKKENSLMVAKPTIARPLCLLHCRLLRVSSNIFKKLDVNKLITKKRK